MQAIIFSLATFFSTLLGGWFAVKYKNRLYFIMAFAAGVLLAVVSFDIMPEIIGQLEANRQAPLPVMVALVAGFLVFHILEKTILIHSAHEGDYAEHKHPQVGVLSALALAGHSFMDGVSIGLGFHISPAIGALMALAVIAHDFTDGMNTVMFMLNHKNTDRQAGYFLLLDALAPVLGAASTLFFKISPYWLTLYLGFFAGFLLYIGAADILPEAHSRQSSFKLIGLTVLGVIFIFAVTRLF